MAEAHPHAPSPWWVLAGACTGLFVLMLDSTVVTLALPAIHDDLDASLDGLQWVQNAYLLTLTATVVTAGRLGDIRGPNGCSSVAWPHLPPAQCSLVPGIIIVAFGAIITWLLVRAPKDPVTPPESELIHHQHHRRFHL